MRKHMDGPFVIWVFLIFLGFLVVGINFFVEDTYSSYYGIRLLEEEYNLRAATWPITYWSMSVMSQLGQIGFFYVFLTDRKNNMWALAVGVVFFVIDAAFDLMYRSNGYVGGVERAGAVGANTAIFSFGAELLITIGIGYVLVLAPAALRETKKLFRGGAQGGQRSRGRGNQKRGKPQQAQQHRGQQPSASSRASEAQRRFMQQEGGRIEMPVPGIPSDL